MIEIQPDELAGVAGGFFRLAGTTRGQRIVNTIGTVATVFGAAYGYLNAAIDIHRTPTGAHKGEE